MTSIKIIDKYNKHCNYNFEYNKIDKYKVSFNTTEIKDKYMILNYNLHNKTRILWVYFQIICSHDIKTGKTLFGKDMILIDKKLISSIYSDRKFNITELEEYILDNIDKNIGLIKEKKDNLIIFYSINKIIKS